MYRRRFLTWLPSSAALGPALAVTRQPRGAEFSLKLAHSTPVTHPLHLRLAEAATGIAAESQGCAELQLFPLDQLGSQPDVLGQVRAGAVDLMAISGLVLSRLVPASAISGLGFVFKDDAAVWRAMDGGLGAFIRAEIDKTGALFAFEHAFDNGFRHITTANRPVLTPADLDGLKLRVPPSALWVSMFKALGTTPVVVNTADLYGALQTRLVDGQENPLALIDSFRLHEVQKHCAMTGHLWDGLWLVGHRAHFAALPVWLRGVLSRHLDAAALQQRRDLARLNPTLRDTLTRKGLRFTDPQPEAFRDRLRHANFYAEWKTRFAPEGWARLEAVSGPI